ncbi:hypothetical protein BKA56DRAFT_606349 [Ilyonectria sp. MPI-CAGE-AT-0026]|nr:hypothetical protein BKA56DRAFT_606349 [Ilyonectria sp. MPI-CAGE-AT-0026]
MNGCWEPANGQRPLGSGAIIDISKATSVALVDIFYRSLNVMAARAIGAILTERRFPSWMHIECSPRANSLPGYSRTRVTQFSCNPRSS